MAGPAGGGGKVRRVIRWGSKGGMGCWGAEYT